MPPRYIKKPFFFFFFSKGRTGKGLMETFKGLGKWGLEMSPKRPRLSGKQGFEGTTRGPFRTAGWVQSGAERWAGRSVGREGGWGRWKRCSRPAAPGQGLCGRAPGPCSRWSVGETEWGGATHGHARTQFDSAPKTAELFGCCAATAACGPRRPGAGGRG